MRADVSASVARPPRAREMNRLCPGPVLGRGEPPTWVTIRGPGRAARDLADGGGVAGLQAAWILGAAVAGWPQVQPGKASRWAMRAAVGLPLRWVRFWFALHWARSLLMPKLRARSG